MKLIKNEQIVIFTVFFVFLVSYMYRLPEITTMNLNGNVSTAVIAGIALMVFQYYVLRDVYIGNSIKPLSYLSPTALITLCGFFWYMGVAGVHNGFNLNLSTSTKVISLAAILSTVLSYITITTLKK